MFMLFLLAMNIGVLAGGLVQLGKGSSGGSDDDNGPFYPCAKGTNETTSRRGPEHKCSGPCSFYKASART